MAFKGIGVVHVENGKYSVSGLIVPGDNETWTADSEHEKIDLNYYDEKSVPSYAYERDGVIFPIYENEVSGAYHLAPERYFHNSIPPQTMIRKWEEFKEYESHPLFTDYVKTVKGANVTKVSLSPKFKVQCLQLFVEDQGYLYGCFQFEGEKYGSETVMRSEFFTDAQVWDDIYRYRGVDNWETLPSFCGETFSLMAVHNNSKCKSWNEVFNNGKWKLLYKASRRNGLFDGLDGVLPPFQDKLMKFEYDGLNHRPGECSTESYSIEYKPNGEWIDVGDYSIIVRLKPEKKWLGGNRDDRKIVAKIYPAKNNWLEKPVISKSGWEVGEAAGVITAEAKFGTVKILYDDSRENQMPTSVGRHTAYISVEAGKTYEGLSAVPLEFEIKQCELGNELAFLRVFKKYVQECGFNYMDRDLERFHTCVKTGMMTLLGGDPGSGKSSLFELYARALAGNSERDNFKRVDVNPTWMEPSDLMGYSTPNVNDPNGGVRFHESQCGLRKFLAELKSSSQDKRAPAFACFEEMNLARIELYFAEFIQLVSRYELTSKNKELPSYGGDGVNAPLTIPSDIRFVGTCNEDPTVKPMSNRFLDRSSVIRLSGNNKAWRMDPNANEEFRLFVCGRGSIVNRSGPMVSACDYEKWIRIPSPEDTEKIGATLDGILNEVRKTLSEIVVCPSPRVIGEMLRYVVNRPFPDGVPDDVRLYVALDEALVQRVISKCVPNALMRGKFSAAAKQVKKVFDGKLLCVNMTSLTAERLKELETETNSLFQWGGVEDDSNVANME